MTTLAELIRHAERTVAAKKVAADAARAGSDKLAEVLAVEAHRDAGRELVSLRFEAEVDALMSRWAQQSYPASWSREEVDAACGIDPTLLALTPVDATGARDMCWLAAMVAARAGAKVPQGWRSPLGEPLHDYRNDGRSG
jgi:hypothetical protein